MELFQKITELYANGELEIQPPSDTECDTERFHDRYVKSLLESDFEKASDMENAFYRMFTNTTERAFKDGLMVGMAMVRSAEERMGAAV